MRQEFNAITSTHHQEAKAIFLKPLAADKLVKYANARYHLAQKALVHTQTVQEKRYWKGYQDALQDVLQQSKSVAKADNS